MGLIIEGSIVLVLLFAAASIVIKSGLWSAWRNKVKYEAQQLAEQQRDPVAEGTLAIQQAEEALESAITKKRNLLVHIRGLEDKVSVFNKDIAKFEGLAQAAGKKQNGDHVRLALEQKKTVTTQLNMFSAQLDAARKQADQYTEVIDNRRTTIEKAKANKELLATGIYLDKFRQDIAIDVNGLDVADGALARLEADATKERHKAEVYEAEAEDANTIANLEDTYGGHAASVSDDDIAKYMTPKQETAT